MTNSTLMREMIFIVCNKKGGAGKSTAANQFIAPFLAENLKSGGKKVKLIEIDDNNNSRAAYAESKLTDSVLIADAGKELEKICLKEFSMAGREYPIIFDIGVGYFEQALETLSNVLLDERVVFIVPAKQSPDDAINSKTTIGKILEYNPLAKIVVICSDAMYDYGQEDDLREEFGILFGKYINTRTNKFMQTIFDDFKIGENFVSIKKSSLFIEAGVTFLTTIYEAGEIGKTIHKGDGVRHPLELEIDVIREKISAELAKEKPSQKTIDGLNSEIEICRTKLVFYKKCAKYSTTHLSPIFRDFAKILDGLFPKA
ncbi:MAG: hypothetical protein A3F91_09245 [Flavobacteria bacterium RIFCSPLOWO2_12_FULL_35_11]|nr:MAG: hypothetical protein A3F91_09245 [Flavobacteria bacterium RIFCSPLOWO2_12_FULL_35_11]